MGKFTAIIIKNLIKTTLDMYGLNIMIAIFVTVELTTCAIVIWQTISGKNLVDLIWESITGDTFRQKR